MYRDDWEEGLEALILIVLPILGAIGIARRYGKRVLCILLLLSAVSVTLGGWLLITWSHEVIRACDWGVCGPENGPTGTQSLIEGFLFAWPVAVFYGFGIREAAHRLMNRRNRRREAR